MTITSSSSLREYVDAFDDLPPDLLLGRIVFYTISDNQVSREALVKKFQELGLDEKYLPTTNKYQHAFEKATSDMNGKSYPLAGERTAHILCRNVSHSRDQTTRQITREIQDSKARKLAYGEVISVVFYRPSDPANQSTAKLRIRINPDDLELDEKEHVQAIARDIKAQYDRYYDFLDGQKIRAMVRNYLRHLNSIEIKGGVYFIHANRDEELARLRELVNWLGGGCFMEQIPVGDLEGQRKFITRSFEREAGQALSDLIRDMDALMVGKQVVTPAAYAKMKVRYDELVENATEHMMKLRTSQDITSASASVALDRLASLTELMLSSK